MVSKFIIIIVTNFWGKSGAARQRLKGDPSGGKFGDLGHEASGVKKIFAEPVAYLLVIYITIPWTKKIIFTAPWAS